MQNLKNNLLEALHCVLSKNVLGDKQYESRYKGFIGELSFQDWIRKNRESSIFFSGGYLLPRIPKSRSIDYPVYFTVSSAQPDKFIEIYSSLSKLSCESMFFIHWNNQICFSEWEISLNILQGTSLKVPPLHVYRFDKELSAFLPVPLGEFINQFPLKKSRTASQSIPMNTVHNWKTKLLEYEYDDLLDLYVQRLIFDGFIGYSREHGIPSDIDSIVFSHKLKSYVILEIKEKDISKRPPQGFGMDVERIADLTKLKNTTKLPIYYIVRQIDNQTDRKFLSWKFIEIDDFKDNLTNSTLQGGSGMGVKHGQYPTRICPFAYFKNLK